MVWRWPQWFYQVVQSFGGRSAENSRLGSQNTWHEKYRNYGSFISVWKLSATIEVEETSSLVVQKYQIFREGDEILARCTE